ncbi:hypothetical protein BDV24DRAFT_160212 [Aspergillus arachidicola]|uniref:Uncharacterized protein n=1 Tax=Aspergillus arachidicola TaxID=656916 RepID=A0A5N6YKB5_9EURO|nr:hypothetical protein BDV24DRAFT_160212 [Aspergillus arachidicola]
MKLLMEGDHKALLERMVVENEALRSKLNGFRAKFEQINRISADCLESDEEWNLSGLSTASSSTSTPSGPKPSEHSSAPNYQAKKAPGNTGRISSQQPSIFLESMRAMKHSMDCDPLDMSTHQFIEAVMAWKYSKGLTGGLDYLAQNFDLHHVVENGKNSESELDEMMPYIREPLSKTWREQDTENLIRNLIRGFSIHIGIAEEWPLIYTKNGSELELSEDFEKALADTSNFCRQVNILSLPQEASTYVGTESHVACATVQTAGNTMTNPFPEPSSSLSHAYLLGEARPDNLSDSLLSSRLYSTERHGRDEAPRSCSSLETTAAGAASTYAPVAVHEHIRGTSD